MHTAAAAVPTRSAQTRTADGEPNVTSRAACARARSAGAQSAGTVVYVSMRCVRIPLAASPSARKEHTAGPGLGLGQSLGGKLGREGLAVCFAG